MPNDWPEPAIILPNGDWYNDWYKKVSLHCDDKERVIEERRRIAEEIRRRAVFYHATRTVLMLDIRRLCAYYVYASFDD
jgi:hypothetical protein